MKRDHYAKLAMAASMMLSGCGGKTLTPNQKAEATREWNGARASVLASLAADQFKDGSLEKCQETLDQAFRLEPGNPKLHLQQAKLSIEQGKLEVADSHLATAAKLNPKDAEVDYLAGIVLQRWQQPDKARAKYAEAARKDPSELSYVLAEAEMLVAVNQPAEAITLLQSQIHFFEHSSTIRDEIGQLLIQQNQYSQGIPMLREANLLATDDLTIREHLAFALLADRQFAESAARLEELSAETAYLKRADICAALGECHVQSKRLPDAQKSYEQATQLNPSCAGYWIGLGKVTMQLADYPRAEIAIRRAISLETGSSAARNLLGYIKLKENQLPAALEEFRNASRLNAADSVSLCMQGYTLQHMGNRVDAKLLYAQAMQLDPQDALAKNLYVNCDGQSHPH